MGGEDCDCCLGTTILVTMGGAGAPAGVAEVVAAGLCAPVRERVVTCGRSMMMLDVQMLVMVLLSGANCGMRDERNGVGVGSGAAGGDGGAASNTSIVAGCKQKQ